jgi:hypothetical protein
MVESSPVGGKASGVAERKGAHDADTNRAQEREDQGAVGSFKEVPFSSADSSSVFATSDREGCNSKSKGKGGKPLLKCSRTKWAVCMIVGIVLVLGAVGGGVAAYMQRRPKASAGAGAAAAPATKQPMAQPGGAAGEVGSNGTLSPV